MQVFKKSCCVSFNTNATTYNSNKFFNSVHPSCSLSHLTSHRLDSTSIVHRKTKTNCKRKATIMIYPMLMLFYIHQNACLTKRKLLCCSFQSMFMIISIRELQEWAALQRKVSRSHGEQRAGRDHVLTSKDCSTQGSGTEESRPSSQHASPEQRGKSEDKSQSARYQAEPKHTNKIAQKRVTAEGLSLNAVPGPTGRQHVGGGPR